MHDTVHKRGRRGVAHGEEAMAEELSGEAGGGHQQEEVVLGDAELDVLPCAALAPVVE